MKALVDGRGAEFPGYSAYAGRGRVLLRTRCCARIRVGRPNALTPRQMLELVKTRLPAIPEVLFLDGASLDLLLEPHDQYQRP